MDAAGQTSATVGDQLPWLKMTMDYTDEIAALIPEDKLDWRPTDPSGRFCFSLGEIAMHCADTRQMFARQLANDESEDGYWSEGPNEEGVWMFKAPASKQEILDSLKAGRELVERFMAEPVAKLLEPTEGTSKAHAKNIARLREAGKDSDVASAERRGPATYFRVLMATATHEAGHRGALQTLLRQQGINAKYGE